MQCDFCESWGMMGGNIQHIAGLDKFLCTYCLQNMPCDYCERKGPFGEFIKFCSQCNKLFCPRCKWKLPTRAMNAVREKVFGQHTGRRRPGFR